MVTIRSPRNTAWYFFMAAYASCLFIITSLMFQMKKARLGEFKEESRLFRGAGGGRRCVSYWSWVVTACPPALVQNMPSLTGMGAFASAPASGGDLQGCFIFCCCHNKLSQMQRLKTTPTDFLTFLSVKILVGTARSLLRVSQG